VPALGVFKVPQWGGPQAYEATKCSAKGLVRPVVVFTHVSTFSNRKAKSLSWVGDIVEEELEAEC